MHSEKNDGGGGAEKAPPPPPMGLGLMQNTKIKEI